MPKGFPVLSSAFFGRDEYIARFKARLDYFQLFLYEGIPGIGKTALLFRLAQEARRGGLSGAIYLPLWPGETIASIAARAEARLLPTRTRVDASRDAYSRLAQVLDQRRSLLLLDDVHYLRREELVGLLRALRARRGRYRIVGAMRGEPELPGAERMEIHLERLGPLTASEVRKFASSKRVRGEALERLTTDAARSGVSGHPLTLKYMLALFGQNPPGDDFLAGQTSRSVNAFRLLVQRSGDHLDARERTALMGLARVGIPISRAAAARAFGAGVGKLVQRGLVDLIDGDVYIHELAAQAFAGELKLQSGTVKALAKHLQDVGIARAEPARVLRGADLLASIGNAPAAVETLTRVWDAARDLGFLEAYLKSVAAIPSTPALQQRLRLLSAQARMRQGNVASVREELEEIARSRDVWTRSHAHAALTHVYAELNEPAKSAAAFETLRRATHNADLVLPAGAIATKALMDVGQEVEAEKLGLWLLARTKGAKLLALEGELRRLLSRLYAESGRLAEAVAQAQAAAKTFEQSGDLQRAATSYGYMGDIYRETGDFELAKSAFAKFRESALRWGDRNLVQIADLADAWVLLDIGDLTHAARTIAAVEKEMGVAPSRRLRRYLAAAKALLEFGRGHHRVAAEQLERVIEAWDGAGQHAIADVLRCQQIRALIASSDLDKARELVDASLARLDPHTAAPRVASFLRESALIRLRRKEVARAMSELAQAQKLFAQGGNRREEALTIYRIAHAALDEGDVKLAASRAEDALALGRKIKHARVVALARELQGRLALIEGHAKAAVAGAREAQQALRRLGDELGTLHVSETLLRAMIVAGDLAGAIRIGPKVSDHAEELGLREVRVRAIVLTGMALLRRGRREAAARCFKEVPEEALAANTSALMWRLGEALASVAGQESEVLKRRAQWVLALRRLPEHQQDTARRSLEQLDMPPRERCRLRTADGLTLVGTEEIGVLEPNKYDLFVDLPGKRLFDSGKLVTITPEMQRLLSQLIISAPKVVDVAAIYKTVFGEEAQGDADKKMSTAIEELLRSAKDAQHLSIVSVNGGLKLVPPKSYAFLFPRVLELARLDGTQKRVMKLLRRYGTLPLQAIQDDCKLTRAATRKELGALVKQGLLEVVREGRGQAFRLA